MRLHAQRPTPCACTGAMLFADSAAGSRSAAYTPRCRALTAASRALPLLHSLPLLPLLSRCCLCHLCLASAALPPTTIATG